MRYGKLVVAKTNKRYLLFQLSEDKAGHLSQIREKGIGFLNSALDGHDV
jgi:hypothetical protein